MKTKKPIRMEKKEAKPTVISLFSGCGGLDLGFLNEGFEVVWANDFFPDAVETYKKNIGNHIVLGDITKIDSASIPKADVLLGGFPCQGFSIANTRRSMDDERNFLYREMLRIIKDIQPKVFVGENVKGLLSMQNGKVMEMIVNDFRELGYEVEYKVLCASDYGVPQNRERVLILGNKINVENRFPEKTHFSREEIKTKSHKKHISVKEAIGHLKEITITNNPIKLNNELVYNHIANTNVHDKFWARKHKVNQAEICDYLKFWRNKKGISTKKVDEFFGYKHTAGHWFRKDNNCGSIPHPDDWWRLKELLGFDNKYDKQVTELELREIKYEQSLRISNWDEPSDTITATGPEIHPNKKRRLSVRECAILQTFPNNFIFTGSTNNMYKQIGNAVPVNMARAIAKDVKAMLRQE